MSNRGISRVFGGLVIGAGLIALGLPAEPVRALTITPTFGPTITSDSNAATIESVINSTISGYESTFSDPINVAIEFNEMGSGLGESSDFGFQVNYQTFYNQLKLDRKSSDDVTAVNTLPNTTTNPVNGSTHIIAKAAELRAIGFTVSTQTFGDGYIGDGEIGLNTSIINITRPPGNSGKYDLQAVVSHEMDEVLGLGSDVGQTGFFADPTPEDLFRYSSSHTRNYTTSGDDAWFSINGTINLVQFNQSGGGADYGDWHTSATVRVQDAFGTPGTDPNLSSVELSALDVIGYDLAPEPASMALVIVGAMLILPRRRRA